MEDLRQRVDELFVRVAELEARNAELERPNAELERRNAELEYELKRRGKKDTPQPNAKKLGRKNGLNFLEYGLSVLHAHQTDAPWPLPIDSR